MPELPPDQEKELVEALKSLGWHLRLDGVNMGTIHARCSELTSDETARAILQGLVQRGSLNKKLSRAANLPPPRNRCPLPNPGGPKAARPIRSAA
jgi:hypothetical protein